jgi:hypothetical protein
MFIFSHGEPEVLPPYPYARELPQNLDIISFDSIGAWASAAGPPARKVKGARHHSAIGKI